MTSLLPTFSQRNGFKPLRDILQVDDVDEALRNRLWTTILDVCLDRLTHAESWDIIRRVWV